MFRSDGCTGVPDFDVRHCCDDHDRAYHFAEISRAKADLFFFQCIVRKAKKGFLSKLKYNFIGLYYWTGVRLLGKKYYNGNN